LFDEYFPFPDYFPSREFLGTNFSKINAKRARFLIKREVEKAIKVKFVTNKPLTKQQVISYLATKVRLPKWTVASIMEEIVTLAIDEIKNKISFSLPGIGKIELSKTRPISLINPQTRRRFHIPAKEVLRMRFHNAFKGAIIPIKKKGKR
jgi:DNA-binding protein HU-beta